MGDRKDESTVYATAVSWLQDNQSSGVYIDLNKEKYKLASYTKINAQ